MARRHNSKRRRRRGRFGFLYKLLCVLVICAAIVAALTLFFKVEEIQVLGQNRYTEAELLEATGVEPGDNLILLNKATVSSNICQKLPYVESVRVNRQFPSTLVVEVTECRAAAALVQGGVGWLISPSGKLVEQTKPAQAKAYPQVDGCTLVEPSVGEMLELDNVSSLHSLLSLLGALEDAGVLDQLQAIHLDDAALITMDYADRFLVELPRDIDYAKKIYKLEKAIAMLETNETGTFDMTDDTQVFFIP